MRNNFYLLLFIKHRLIKFVAVSTAILSSLSSFGQQGGYVSGDFHQHTTFTDGSYSFDHMMSKNNSFGLDWWANSEHGGSFPRDGRYSGTDLGTTVYWDEEEDVTISGDSVGSDGHQSMWRWQSLMEYSFPKIEEARSTYSDKVIIQGYEMNIPGHEHGSVAIITGQFDETDPNANALAQFEYMFDSSDADETGGAAEGWTKSILSGHEKTLEAINWMETNHSATSWLIPAHPERKQKYTISDFRDMNNAGPDVCFGFESMPGHQKNANRGGYSSSADGGGTFGGCGYYAATVGGLWDAMLSEGRNWWLFASSDFHTEDGDFYPGEYEKTYTYVDDKSDAQAIVDGLRSGNSWIVEGDLIDDLEFSIGDSTMGQTLQATESQVTVTITVHDPQGTNYNTYSDYTNPVLDHIDLIAGSVTGYVESTSDSYDVDSVTTTSVIARFDAEGNVTDGNGITSTAWTDKGDGYYEMSFETTVSSDMYFRLRGTNQGLGIENQTDANGNPLPDSLVTNNATAAFADLWFYSNPVFVTASGIENSIDENEVGVAMKVYPNPVDNMVNVSFDESENTIIKIMTVGGNVIYTTQGLGKDFSVDVSNLASGVYFVAVQRDGKQEITKIIKH